MLEDLKRLVEPATLGDPIRPLLWVSKSHDKLAVALAEMGHSISANSVRKLLAELGFSPAVEPQSHEGTSIPTATRNSSTSTPGGSRRRRQANPSSPSIRRRKS